MKALLQKLLELSKRALHNFAERVVTSREILSPKFTQYKGNKRLLRAIALLITTFALLQITSQLQFKNFLDTETKAFSSLERYAKFYSSSRPTVNDQGIAQYQGYVGIVAWDVFVSTSLNSQAAFTFDRLTLLQYELESTNILPLFAKKVEAKNQTIKYFATVNQYLNAVQNCRDENCFNKASKIYEDANAQVVELALKRAIPRIDVLGLSEKLNNY